MGVVIIEVRGEIKMLTFTVKSEELEKVIADRERRLQICKRSTIEYETEIEHLKWLRRFTDVEFNEFGEEEEECQNLANLSEHFKRKIRDTVDLTKAEADKVIEDITLRGSEGFSLKKGLR